MPVVPVYNPGQVQPQGVPSVRRDETAPVEAFGGGVSRATQALGDATQGIARIALEEQDKADTLRAMAAHTEAVQGINELKYGKDGLVSYTGERALGAREEFSGRFNQLMDGIGNGLSNSSQKAFFAHMRAKLTADFDGDLYRHFSVEGRKFAEEQVRASVTTLQQDAALNYATPGKVAENLNLITGTVYQHAEHTGIGAKQAALLVAEAKSQTHLAVVDQMLFNRQEKEARDYYEANRDSLTPAEGRAAQKLFHAFSIEKTRIEREEKDALEGLQKKTQDSFLKKLSQNKLTPDEVLKSNLNPFGSGSKEQFLRLIEADGKKDDSETFNDLFRRIHLSDDDPEKIRDENELNKYVIDGKISKDNLGWLRTEIQGGHTSEGKDRQALERGLYSVAKAQLTKGNPMLGIRDPIGEAQLLRFQKYAKEEIRKRQKAGDSVQTLLNPDSKDWLGHQIGRFARSPQEIIRDMTKFAPSSKAGTGADNGNTAPPPREPGESPEAYLKRVKGAE